MSPKSVTSCPAPSTPTVMFPPNTEVTLANIVSSDSSKNHLLFAVAVWKLISNPVSSAPIVKVPLAEIAGV